MSPFPTSLYGSLLVPLPVTFTSPKRYILGLRPLSVLSFVSSIVSGVMFFMFSSSKAKKLFWFCRYELDPPILLYSCVVIRPMFS